MEILEDMKGVIFKPNWSQLGDKEIEIHFKEHFGQFSARPDDHILARLKTLKTATLEIVEDRSLSSVYRIKQTDEVFQVYKSGDIMFFNSTEKYYRTNPPDCLKQVFVRKYPVFKAERLAEDKVIVEHLKNPRFRALFINHSCDMVEWVDPKPVETDLQQKLLNKAGAFFSSYLRK
jgi:hypothetical protein